jgi:hypothetical protein
MPMDEIDRAISREETLLSVIEELMRFMPEPEACRFAAQLLCIGARTAPYRPDTIDNLAERLRGHDHGGYQQ